jgi:23S rRNA pseudouridine2605 synthase
MEKQRLAKFLAAAGLCSRREGEKFIEAGRVKVNQAVITTPAFCVDDSDIVTLDNKTVRPIEQAKLWAFYKPVECITSRIDPEGRKTIYDLLPPSFKNIKYVGRLDYFSEGLLLLTNDGGLVRTLELPKHEIPREYKVRVYGSVDVKLVDTLAKGITIEGENYKPIELHILPAEGKNTWLKFVLKEGKNREIRKILTHFGYKINRLIRMGYGPVSLTGLKTGQLKELDIQQLQTYLKEKV